MHFTKLFLCCLLLAITFSCTEESTHSPAAPDSPASPPPAVQAVVDHRGDELSVSDPENPLFRAGVRIPPDALYSTETISISETPLPAPLPSSRAAGPAVRFQPHPLIFESPVTITLPYGEKFADGTPIPDYQVVARYFDPLAHRWTNMALKTRNTRDKTLTFETSHFSVYIAAVENRPPDRPTYPNTLVPGEYFVGNPEFRIINGEPVLLEKGRINRPGYTKGTPFHLYARYSQEGLILMVDQKASVNTPAGYHAMLRDDGRGAILDTSVLFEAFTKIQASGDARLWRWEAVFVPEHTRLKNYEVIDEQNPYALPFPVGQRIYAEMDALNDREVLLSWGFDIIPELRIDLGDGDEWSYYTLCIAFEATFLGYP
ncbi:hypothetical protein OOT00_10840 [Desulfobotulus sp. H1]|uniref:ZU5 domain-containing protein n=1 Tax=Desulfobotulus pelophilus TaxID=2823377 RepID=A0ABT3NAJ3_9BACT|nr:hypothetical protein [Desulfobotulus pelophilus]MCW7754481.1 hypothetical protein [Desulfobotulus pelophilus]